MSDYVKAASDQPPLDLREKGAPTAGGQQAMDRRLFVHFLAFADCEDAQSVRSPVSRLSKKLAAPLCPQA